MGLMNWDGLISVAEAGRIEWQRHSLERMLERGISREQVKLTFLKGSIIEKNIPMIHPIQALYPKKSSWPRENAELSKKSNRLFRKRLITQRVSLRLVLRLKSLSSGYF